MGTPIIPRFLALILSVGFEDGFQDHPRWIRIPRCPIMAPRVVLYRRKINQPAAANSVRIFWYGAYRSYEFLYGPYEVETAMQRFIFCP
jgi:hypothetical protein